MKNPFRVVACEPLQVVNNIIKSWLFLLFDLDLLAELYDCTVLPSEPTLNCSCQLEFMDIRNVLEVEIISYSDFKAIYRVKIHKSGKRSNQNSNVRSMDKKRKCLSKIGIPDL